MPIPVYDIAIIGGGINGCGIARDAAGRGLTVHLCEQGDLAGATSSASTKLIHGGLRYLEHFAFRLVREALAEREVLLAAGAPYRWTDPPRAAARPRLPSKISIARRPVSLRPYRRSKTVAADAVRRSHHRPKRATAQARISIRLRILGLLGRGCAPGCPQCRRCESPRCAHSYADAGASLPAAPTATGGFYCELGGDWRAPADSGPGAHQRDRPLGRSGAGKFIFKAMPVRPSGWSRGRTS